MSELEEIVAAREAIAGRLVRTPLLDVSESFPEPRVQLFFKPEMLQKTGSFKIRGVLNKLASLSQEDKARGVVGMSSGNHAQALAYGARTIGAPATIVMPTYSVDYKIEATKTYGAEVVMCEASELLATYERVRAERNLAPVHPFDDPKIIAGAGTIGLELEEDIPDLDVVFVSVGGGGLLSGVATALKLRRPAIRVVGVEPEGAAALRKSLDAGRLVTLDKVDTVADGLAPPFTGETVYDRVRRYVDDVITVSDKQIIKAMREIVERAKLVAEPSAAASLAGLLSGQIVVDDGAKVACILSGGNINASRLQTLLD